MRKVNRWSWILALLALLPFIACQGESPTAPTPGPGTGTPPPANATLTLSVSNQAPLVSSTTVISATATQGGAPVPNGTAVEFQTDLGVFSDSGTKKTIRTTTGGTATATLSSTTPGIATVTARVNTESKSIQITFKDVPSTPPPPDTAMAITSIDPTFGTPSGGQVVRILGRNFREPIRVLFGTQEARLISMTSTEIKVLTPAITLGPTAQALEVDVTVLNEAGTSAEQRGIAPQKFRYQLEILTPNIFTVSPSSGPNEGNTRITIFGEGFQSPLKVYFGTGGSVGGSLTNQVEVDVVSVTFNTIIAMTPPALGLGFPLQNEQVELRVQNVASNTDDVLDDAFRYGPEMEITAISPGSGPFTGGTSVTIFGWGFDDPVAVSFGTTPVQVIRVSGTEIVVVTPSVDVAGCAASGGGAVSVTKIEEGGAPVTGPSFTFIVPKPLILSVTPVSAGPGAVITVAVQDALGTPRFIIGDLPAVIQSATTVGRVTTFALIVPPTFEFETVACTAGGERNVPTLTDVTYMSVTSGCEDTFDNGLTVTPPTTGIITFDPTGFLPFVATFKPATATTPASITASPLQTVALINTGGGPLSITSVTQSASCTNFNVPPVSAQTLQVCDSILLTAVYNPPAGTPQQICTITIVTDVGTRTLQLTGSTSGQ